MTGYTRQSAADIIEGLPITATPIARELNRLAQTFGLGGHTHDGSTGNGPKISLASAITGVLQAPNGGNGGIHRFTATTDPLATDDSVVGYAVGSLWLNLNGPRLFVCTSATPNTAKWRFISLVNDLGEILPRANALNALGNSSARFTDLYITDVDAKSIYVNGPITATGPITGNLSGNVTGNLTGNVVGNVTGNVTADSGTTTLFNLVINNTVDFTNTRLQNVAAPTASTDGATKGYVDTKIDALIEAAPGTLDTLNELAAALGDDPNFATTVNASIATKLPKAGGTMTGDIQMGGFKVTGLPTPSLSSDAVRLQYVTDLYGSTSSASVSAALAQEWADKAEDSQVITGKFSAKHHALKAANSATGAATSATNAANSATSASTSATSATTSKNAAATSATNAANSAIAANSTFIEFEKHYLGAYGSDPTVDNTGAALTAGALYFNTVSKVIRAYNGSVWSNYVYNEAAVSITGGSINVPTLKVSGNSVWHSGNDGTGSGLDADLLRGFVLTSLPTPDTIVRRNAAGEVSGLLVRATGGNPVSLASTNHPFQVGPDNNNNIAIGTAAIHARLNGAATILGLNPLGGDVQINQQKAWHAGNGGSGSGLDADLLDGQHAAYFQRYTGDISQIDINYKGSGDRNALVDFHTAGVPGAAINARIYRKPGVNGAFEITNTGSGNIDFQADTNNSVRINGNIIWNANNDGAGSGLDADRLDGFDSSHLDVANTIVRRDSVADINCRLARQTFANQTSIISTAAIVFRVNDSSDNYLRIITPAGFLDWFSDNSTVGLNGTYAMMQQQNAPNYSPGDLVAGSNLKYSGVDPGVTATGAIPPGTWRLMGASTQAKSSLWLRVS